MFDYTKMVFEKTVKDIKSVAYFSNIASQITSLIYLLYALIAQTGLWYVNALLLALSSAYFIYFLHSSNHESKESHPNKKVKKFFIRAKQVVKFFPLAVALYNLCLTVENVNIFTLLSTAFMLISWLLQIVFDVLATIIGKRFELFKAAIEADIEEAKKPIKSVGNFFKRATGQEVQSPQAPSKNRIWLDEQIVGYREAKAEKKRLEKEEKRQRRKAALKSGKRKPSKDENQILEANEQKSLPAPKNNEEEILNEDE